MTHPPLASRLRFSAVTVLLAAPVLLVLGWTWLIVNAGRGADDAWAVGHLVLFSANAFWVPAALILHRDHLPPASRGVRDFTLPLVTFGSLCVAGQLAVDLVAWALAMDTAALRTLFTAIRGQPVLAALFYLVGPPLLFLGLFVVALGLARVEGRRSSGGILVAVGLILVLAGALSTFSVVTLAGYVLVLVGFVLVATVGQPIPNSTAPASNVS